MFIRDGRATGSILVRALADRLKRDAAPEPPEPESAPEPEPALEEPGFTAPPNHSDLKSEWVDYAVGQGHSKEEAEALTKQELIDLFGV